MSIWDKMIGCEKNAHLFPIKMTSNIQSMYEFPRFSKSSSQFIERMLSYVALGCSPLRLNNCFSPNFNVIYLFRNWAEAGWFFLHNVPLLGLEQESTIPAQSSGPVPVLGLFGTRPPQKELICRPLSEASSVL